MEKRLEVLEEKIQRLEDIEAIKVVQGKYLRCLDSKLWEEIKTCFTEDVHTSYSDGALVFDGPEAIADYFAEAMPTSITSHHCHTPEIEITSPTTAKAKWYLGDYLNIPEYNLGIRGAAFYSIEYRKVDGDWLIADIGYNRVFEERWDRANPGNIEVKINMHEKK